MYKPRHAEYTGLMKITKQEFRGFCDSIVHVADATFYVTRPSDEAKEHVNEAFLGLNTTKLTRAEVIEAVELHDRVLAEKVKAFFDAADSIKEHVARRLEGDAS